MIKIAFFFAAVCAAAVAQGPETTPIPIVKFERDGPNHDGTYRFSYETGNGITAEESGLVENFGVPDQESLAVTGFYQYTGPDGVLYKITYTSDKNGFVPTGDHLPTPPPIPEAIAKALEYIKSQPPSAEDGSPSAPLPVYQKPSAAAQHVAQYQPAASAPQPAYRAQPAYQQAASAPQPAYQARPAAYNPYQAAASAPQPAYQAAPAAFNPAYSSPAKQRSYRRVRSPSQRRVRYY